MVRFAMTNPTPFSLGKTGPTVFPLGLGCMGMSGMYGASDDAESIRTIHAALERGVTLLDTGDFYGMGDNEMLLARALEGGKRDRVLLSVKFGAMRGPDGAWVGFDTRPAAIKNFLAYSLKRLRTDHVDVYRPSRLDPTVPIEDTIGTIADLVKKGWVRHIGLSEVGAETIRRAHAVHPIVDLQIEYAAATRGPEAKIFPVLRELGISATLYGVFSRGLLTGSPVGQKGDFRAFLPRFAGDAAQKNASAVEALAALAKDKGTKPATLLLAWVLHRQPGFLPIPGARKLGQLDDCFAALSLSLSESELQAIEAVAKVEGDRYGAEQMRVLDSER